MAYTPDSWWRNRTSFVQGREEIMEFLRQRWARELNYRLIKEIWACTDSRIAVRNCCESQSIGGQWYRSDGNENWEFDDDGLMRQRHSSINDLEIDAAERKFHWPSRRRVRLTTRASASSACRTGSPRVAGGGW